jgi:hypothetical protein
MRFLLLPDLVIGKLPISYSCHSPFTFLHMILMKKNSQLQYCYLHSMFISSNYFFEHGSSLKTTTFFKINFDELG